MYFFYVIGDRQEDGLPACNDRGLIAAAQTQPHVKEPQVHCQYILSAFASILGFRIGCMCA